MGKKLEKILEKTEKFQKIVKKNFMTLCQTVPEIQGVTDIRTNLISNIDGFVFQGLYSSIFMSHFLSFLSLNYGQLV